MVLGLIGMLVACTSGSERVVVAAGTTLVDSGFIDRLASSYESDHPGRELSVIGEASAQVLELGRSGGAQVLLVHAPKLEEAFLAAGEAKSRQTVFTSRFLLVGPADQVASYAGLDFVEAFAALSDAGQAFVSRSDGSGTFEVENQLWAAAGRMPDGQPWYIETGQGMGITLQVADQRQAFTLAEEGAYLASARSLDLSVVELVDDLTNPYSVILVKDSSEAASDFAAWLVSDDGKRAIEQINQELFDQLVYRP